jgi:23S rRNA (cytosine1962-C5)-methyltransferase
MSALALLPLAEEVMAGAGGSIEIGDMGVREAARDLILPTAIYARWSAG